MEKKILLPIIFLFLPLIILAQGMETDRISAGEVARKFYYQKTYSKTGTTLEDIKITGSFVIENQESALYYVFNLSPGGFVAVSATMQTRPVLCYSFKGKYDPASLPDNFSAWMKQYERQISYAMSTRAVPDDESVALWKFYSEADADDLKIKGGREIPPMLTTTWDQGTFYNEQCPADPAGPGGHCVTGCVATALGQLVNYFRWPETGMGSYSYDCPPYGTLSADFGSAEYRFDLMETSLDHSNPEVAEIINHLGISVDMVYGPAGSGMYNHKAAYTLRTFFKYSPETQYVFRDSTSMDWDSLLVSHLDRNIPMYYAGWSVPDTNGHAFICDGYQEGNYYHFNWGWGGSYDGYFYTDNLTPGGNFFNLAQELVINAVPDTNLYAYPSYCQDQKVFTELFGTIDDGSGPMYGYSNSAGCSWLITPNDTINGINLNFLHFSTDPADTLTVYEGSTTNDPIIGQYSGSDIPSSLSSENPSLLLVFESGPESTGDGFLLAFESEIPVFCSGMVMLSDQNDTLSDGSGNWNYHNNSACLWRIMPEGASSVTLYFEEFSTEEGMDILKVYDLQTQQLLAEYSGNYGSGVPDPVTSPSGKMFITFNTNTSVTASGWKAVYESNLVGMDDNDSPTRVLVYPNPASEYITIDLGSSSEKKVFVSLTDPAGRTILSGTYPTDNGRIFMNVGDFTPGMYLVKVKAYNDTPYFSRLFIR